MIETVPMPGLLSGYQLWNGVYDEMCEAPGRLRPCWSALISDLQTLGAAEVQRRWEQAQQQLRDLGATFNPHDETGEGSRPWELDAVPLLISQADWKSLERGLEQRGVLYEHILTDLFGPQSLIRDGIVPPDLLFAHPSYYPAYHGLPTPQSRRLVLCATDLARSADGRWWVTADRTRAPAGLGYVLENRIVTSRMLPSSLRQCSVQRLARFFMGLRETLHALAPRYRDNPRIVLWTLGATTPNYFEDAYLSRYLGYTLVEGGDLAVRNNRVMLKTLGGLLPVEVILRRVDDEACDPVELDPASVAGIAGLVEVERAGNVAIANALGSRLVESLAWLPLLPQVCRRVLGEDLLLPSLPTWWCGQDSARQYVLDHLDELVIRPAHRLVDGPPVYPSQLSRAARDELAAAIRAQPLKFVGQEQVQRSTTPVWVEGSLRPWPMALRCFQLGNDDRIRVLPGGLARAAATPEELDAIMGGGQRSLDVWVLSEGPVEQVSLLSPPGASEPLRRSGSELPSRVAENLFWLGRNVERADGSTRLLRTVFARLASEEDWDSAEELPVMLRMLAEQGQIEPGFLLDGLRQSLPDVQRVLPEVVFNESELRSLRTTINHIVKIASAVRDRLSVDAWRIIHQIDQAGRRPRIDDDDLDANDMLRLMQHVLRELAAFAGLASESMTRTQGWRFLELGRRIERAWHMAALLQATVTQNHSAEQPVFEAVLETADSIMTYRSRYLANLQAAPLVDLLLTDETNPRSIVYQLVAIHDHVNELPRSDQRAVRAPEERLALSMLNMVRLADVYELCQRNPSGERPALQRLLTRLQEQLPKLSDAIAGRFLIHTGLPRHFEAASTSRP